MIKRYEIDWGMEMLAEYKNGSLVKYEDIKPIIERHDKLIGKMVVDDDGIRFTEYEWPGVEPEKPWPKPEENINKYEEYIKNKHDINNKDKITLTKEEITKIEAAAIARAICIIHADKMKDFIKNGYKEPEEKKCNCAEMLEEVLIQQRKYDELINRTPFYVMGKKTIEREWICPIHGYKKR